MMYKDKHQDICVECDECGQEEICEVETYSEASKILRDLGWEVSKIDDGADGPEWQHLCPECKVANGDY